MGKFTDNAGRSWEPEVNVVTIGRVRDRLGINLLELLLPNNTLAERLNDPCLLVDVLYLLCKDQADAQGVSDTDFGKSQNMDGIEDAWSAVLEGLVLFSPRGLRPAHQKVLEKARKYQAAAESQIKTLVAGPEFDAMLEREIARRLSPPTTLPSESTGDAGNSPESLASNPDAIPSPD
jgi:hypothetical protein